MEIVNQGLDLTKSFCFADVLLEERDFFNDFVLISIGKSCSIDLVVQLFDGGFDIIPIIQIFIIQQFYDLLSLLF